MDTGKARRVRISEEQRVMLLALKIWKDSGLSFGCPARMLYSAVWGSPSMYIGNGEHSTAMYRSLDRLVARGLVRKERLRRSRSTKNGYSVWLQNPEYHITPEGIDYLSQTTSTKEPRPYFGQSLKSGQEDQKWRASVGLSVETNQFYRRPLGGYY